MSDGHYKPDRAYFTLVFEGDIREIKKSPLYEMTEFGKCIVISVGDMTDEVAFLESRVRDLKRSCR